MSRALALVVFAVSLLVGAGGIHFLLLHPHPNSVAPVSSLSTAEVLATAQSRVAAPVPPPQPPNAEIKIAQKPLLLHVPLPQPGQAPAQISRPVPQITVTTPADATWQNQVNAQQAAYEQALQAQIDAILQQQQAAQAASSANASDWITTVLIPLIAAVGGLLTALASLITALRRPAGGPAAS